MADLKISELPVLAGADLDAVDEMALADRSASETRRIDAKKFLEEGVGRVIDDGVIPGAKLTPDSVTSKEIGTDAVSADELADNSVDTAAIQNGAVTNPKVAYGIDGAKLIDDTVTASKIPSASLDRGIDKTSGSIGHTNTVTAQTMSGITFDAEGHIYDAVRLIDTDLPPATTTEIGAVAISLDSGLTVTATGVIDHENNVTASSISGITWDDHGHISNTRALVGTDLPPATTLDLGAVSIPGPVLEVTGAGQIIHGDTPVAPGDYPKVTVDQQGHVTQGLALTRGDIPSLDATVLTTGVLDPERISNLSIKREKLADFAISYIQEAKPDVLAVHHIGCLWYQESTAQLRIWNSNSWMPVGFGRLSEENLRFCGTADATAGTVLDTTTFGIAAGLKTGNAIPAATDALTGAYLVVKTPGTYGGDVYDNGDWILCIGAAGGWVRVDTLTGAGTTTIKVEDLLDVNIGTVSSGDTLIYDSITGKWVNRSTSARKAVFIEPFDGIRTSFTMNTSASDVNNMLINIGGIIQDPGIDFTFTAPRTISFASAPSPGLKYWIIIEGVASTGAGGGGGGTSLPNGTAADEYLQWNNALTAWAPSTTLNGGTY